jgi:RHS repeat-associated protein
VPTAYRGLVTQSVTPAVTTNYDYYDTGGMFYSWGSDGQTLSYYVDSSSNYGPPTEISTQSYSASIGYTSWLAVTQTTGANGEQLSMTYDSYGRPATGVSPYGATTTYTYSAAGTLPQWQEKTISDNQSYTKTYLDGLGRTIRVETGTTSPQQAISYVDTIYAPCACSPLGKIAMVSQPYAPGGTPVWTKYTYDGKGRTLTTLQPDGASTTSYAYSGNQSTVTDAAGHWKQFTTDVLNNLTAVVEPDPCVSSNSLTTSYTYDWMNHVTGVSMPRPNVSYASNGTCSESGSTTQTRTFVYDNVGRLTSATNPENGTVSYVYNSDNTLNYKTDAKGQQTVYTYDTEKRVTMVQRYPQGQNHAEDQCQRVTYTWDSPGNSSAVNTYGRVATATSGTMAVYCVPQNTNGEMLQTEEIYSYHPAGAVTSKTLSVSEAYNYPIDDDGDYGWNSFTRTLTANYSYNQEGNVQSVSYPVTMIDPSWDLEYCDASGDNCYWNANPLTFTYSFDAMGRPTGLSDNFCTSAITNDVYYDYWGFSCSGMSSGMNTVWAQNAQYDVAGRMTSFQYLTALSDNGEGTVHDTYATESMTYNANGQLASLGWSGGTVSGTIAYTFSSTQNNGQITQATDSISGETIVYQYDALRRLTSASSTPTTGSSATAWTQNFGYDGFGNLVSKTLNGGSNLAPAVSAATNRLGTGYYDANGNMTSGAGATFTYDAANRIVSAQETSGGMESYLYDAENRQVYRMLPNGSEEFTFWGAQGEKLGVYSNASGYALRTNVYFAGRMIWSDNVAAYQDRLGTNRASGARFYPYGDEITATSNDREKFATYTRDSYTGLDYSMNRYYASTYGRFNTPDPYMASGRPGDPGSWNRYSYTRGDPVNRFDPTGHDDACGLDGGCQPGCDQKDSDLGCAADDSCGDQVCVNGGGDDTDVIGSSANVTGPVYDVGTTFTASSSADAGSDNSGGNSDDDSVPDDPDPDPGDQPTFSVTTTVGSCIAGWAALGSMVGIDVSAPVLGAVGAVVGGGFGTALATPGVGTLGGGVGGGEIGVTAGTFGGGAVGGAIGGYLGGIFCSSEHTKDARPSTWGKHSTGKARKTKDVKGRRSPPRKRPGWWPIKGGPWPPPPGDWDKFGR